MKVFRKQTGMSQRQFAAYFGISVRTLQEWEQGRQKPPEYLEDLLKRIWAQEGALKTTAKGEIGQMEQKKIDRLYELLERANNEHDSEMAAALKWAIFELEKLYDKEEQA